MTLEFKVLLRGVELRLAAHQKCAKTPGIWDSRHGQGIKDCDPLVMVRETEERDRKETEGETQETRQTRQTEGLASLPFSLHGVVPLPLPACTPG